MIHCIELIKERFLKVCLSQGGERRRVTYKDKHILRNRGSLRETAHASIRITILIFDICDIGSSEHELLIDISMSSGCSLIHCSADLDFNSL